MYEGRSFRLENLGLFKKIPKQFPDYLSNQILTNAKCFQWKIYQIGIQFLQSLLKIVKENYK